MLLIFKDFADRIPRESTSFIFFVFFYNATSRMIYVLLIIYSSMHNSHSSQLFIQAKSWSKNLYIIHISVEANSWFDYVKDWEKTVEEHPDYPIHVMFYEGMKEVSWLIKLRADIFTHHSFTRASLYFHPFKGTTSSNCMKICSLNISSLKRQSIK